jgi:hypothetical protein
MIIGLILLIVSRYTTGYFIYNSFISAEADCVDREIREFIDTDSIGSLIRQTFWEPRILCEFEFRGSAYWVTPIILKLFAFKTKEEATLFLDKRIDENGKCTLWIDPNYPLHSVFHKKPRTGPYTV